MSKGLLAEDFQNQSLRPRDCSSFIFFPPNFPNLTKENNGINKKPQKISPAV
jgi:hypothetical protein